MAFQVLKPHPVKSKVNPEDDPYALAVAESKELATVRGPKSTKLHDALEAGDTEEAARLLESKEVDAGAVDEYGRTALHLEMMRGGTNKINPGNRGDNPLMVACLVNNRPGATHLTDSALGQELIPDVSHINTASNSDGASPLMRAIEGKSVEIADMLMDR